jgi:hypothetical protein
MRRDHASITLDRAPRTPDDDQVRLALRTLARPRPLRPAVPPPAPEPVADPVARWRSALVRAVARPADASLLVAEDGRVAVAPIARIGELDARTLSDARAVVLVHGDEVSPWEAQEALERVERRCPWVEGFAVAGPRDRGGLAESARGIVRQAGADGVSPGSTARWRVSSDSAASRPPSPK